MDMAEFRAMSVCMCVCVCVYVCVCNTRRTLFARNRLHKPSPVCPVHNFYTLISARDLIALLLIRYTCNVY